MGGGCLAEASPCCPSPLLGQLVIAAYVLGGALIYVWMFSMLFRWAHGRYRDRSLRDRAGLVLELGSRHIWTQSS